MKKEVVHVPTRELAEEVLRVAKENGLYEFTTSLDEMIRDSGFLLDISFESETYCELSEYEKNNCKIITAQEFLNRYKPKFRPIAMRCTQEQFEAVKGKLVGFEFGSVFGFDIYKYLVNNNSGKERNVTNVNTHGTEYNREVFEEWDEKIFLEYCGIEVKDEVSEVDRLRKENESLKQQLKAIEDQPKVGDVCLFWDAGNYDAVSMHVLQDIKKGTKYAYSVKNIGSYINCVKATDENIKKVMEQIKLNNK